MGMDNLECEFCSSSARNRVFASSNGFLAIYNISPIVPGHVLVIPRRHEQWLQGLSEEELCAFFSFGRKITNFIVATYSAEGYDWTIQQAELAGQTVPHLHLHVIPRKPNDLDKDWHDELEEAESDKSHRRKLTPEQAADIAAKLRSQAQDAGL